MRVRELVNNGRETAAALAQGVYVEGWEHRALIISAASDYLSLRARDDAFVSDEMDERDVSPETDSGVRRAAAAAMNAISKSTTNTIPAVPRAVGNDASIMHDLCGSLDYSEKIALSATAHALHAFDMPLDLFSAVGNILFEEAYHLRVVSDVLGLDQSERAWLPADKATNWDLVRRCTNAYEYMLLEHALFEGRGGLAAAKGVYEARAAGVSPTITRLFERICKQETNHAVKGFLWMDNLRRGNALPESVKPIVREFVEKECADTSGTFRTTRQRYSAWQLVRYLDGMPIGEIIADIKRHSMQCMTTGNADLPHADVVRAADELYGRLE